MKPRYFLLYKPFGMLSQFSRETPEQRTLADLDVVFPKDVYPVGRLDADSEGLLLLTNDKSLNARLLNPRFEHPRTYWAQVEGIPDEAALEQLRAGVTIRIDGKSFQTRPAKVEVLTVQPELPERHPPVRFRKTVPDAWLELTLVEGKNRQVRRMCAAVGLPVLRLVRVAIGDILRGDMQPGEVREIDLPAPWKSR
ncbi:MAG: pseudouridine synthase [Saprospiraceae bacterium]|nr:pseudouridine synthase [Saprospiraceae bacterium]